MQRVLPARPLPPDQASGCGNLNHAEEVVRRWRNVRERFDGEGHKRKHNERLYGEIEQASGVSVISLDDGLDIHKVHCQPGIRPASPFVAISMTLSKSSKLERRG